MLWVKRYRTILSKYHRVAMQLVAIITEDWGTKIVLAVLESIQVYKYILKIVEQIEWIGWCGYIVIVYYLQEYK